MGYLFSMKLQIPEFLPIIKEVETRVVLRKAALAHMALAELKGVIGLYCMTQDYLSRHKLSRIYSYVGLKSQYYAASTQRNHAFT